MSKVQEKNITAPFVAEVHNATSAVSSEITNRTNADNTINQNFQDAASDKPSYYFRNTLVIGPASAILKLGTSAFSIFFQFRADQKGTQTQTYAGQIITLNGSAGTSCVIGVVAAAGATQGYLKYAPAPGTYPNTIANFNLIDGKDHTCLVGRDASGNLFFYVDGNAISILSGSTTDTTNYSDATIHFDVNNGSGYGVIGQCYRAGIVNYKPSADKILRYSRGAKLDQVDNNGSMVALVAGYALVVGKNYRIVARNTLDFTSCGAANNNSGTEFVCTTTGTLAGTDSVLILGALVLLEPEGITTGKWLDQSGNGLDCTNSGGVPSNIDNQWRSYTTTLTNAGNATQAFRYRVINNSLEIVGTIVIGSSAPTGSILFTLPPGFNANFAAQPLGIQAANEYQMVGTAFAFSQTPKFAVGIVIRNIASLTTFRMHGNDATYGSSVNWGITAGTITFTTNDTISVSLSVPL